MANVTPRRPELDFFFDVFDQPSYVNMCLGLGAQIREYLNTRRAAEPARWPKEAPRAPKNRSTHNPSRADQPQTFAAGDRELAALLSARGTGETVTRKLRRDLFGKAAVYFAEEAVTKLQDIDVAQRNELAHPRGQILLLGLVAIWWGHAGRRAENSRLHAGSNFRILDIHFQEEGLQQLVGICLATVPAPAHSSSDPSLDYVARSKAEAERLWQEVTSRLPPTTSQQMQRVLGEAWKM